MRHSTVADKTIGAVASVCAVVLYSPGGAYVIQGSLGPSTHTSLHKNMEFRGFNANAKQIWPLQRKLVHSLLSCICYTVHFIATRLLYFNYKQACLNMDLNESVLQLKCLL